MPEYIVELSRRGVMEKWSPLFNEQPITNRTVFIGPPGIYRCWVKSF